MTDLESTGLANPKVFPLANETLSSRIFNTVQKAKTHSQLKTGAYETTKTLYRKKQAWFIVIAADAKRSTIRHLLFICEKKSVPYVFVKGDIRTNMRRTKPSDNLLHVNK
ncbi:hypothetical protein DMN91_009289 [Ooceraea biroi]|uniref:H/ACA ribonucleoprotein complex subunit 2 n=1 Tax=Ooceraea biroi TaxID=2015173 RepID=A0A3L8DF31_OOCBI|nr:hypothetical protein DMN91_009289 [Ooceraea biroi]